MKQDSNGTYHDYEFQIKFKKKLSLDQLNQIIIAIKKSPLFHRSYQLNSITWYELRNKENQDIHKEPNASIYIMSEKEDFWHNLKHLKNYISPFTNGPTWT